jgi:asparagine synthase (glutamine-hydrolysing)
VPLRLRKATLGALALRLPDHVRGRGLLRRLSLGPAARYQAQIGLFDLAERRRLLRAELAPSSREARLFEPYFQSNSLDRLSLCQLVDQNTYLPEDVLVKVDRAAMRSALEVRIPFLDHRLVEFVNALPAGLKRRRGTTKYLLRRAMSDVLPPEVIQGPKQGFGIPIKYWLRDELGTFARERLLSPGGRALDYLNRAAVENVLRSHQRGGRDLSDRIWALLVLEEWCAHARL